MQATSEIKMIASRILVVAVTMIVSMTVVAINVKRTQKRESIQSFASSQATEPQGEKIARNKLASLLAPEGIQVGSRPETLETGAYRELQIHWDTKTQKGSSVPAEAAQAPLGVLTVKHFKVASGQLQRLRSLELATTQILVVALDANANLVWWHLQTDPRLLRAETVSATGEMTGQISYLPQIDFSIAYPDDPTIVELRFYQPEWTGQDFRLRSLGTLSLP
jgi:hypothetical protein